MTLQEWVDEHETEFREILFEMDYSSYHIMGDEVECVVDERDIGCGDYDGWTWVFKWRDKFWRVDGYYSSWDGMEIEDITPYEVVPQERVVVDYVPKN